MSLGKMATIKRWQALSSDEYPDPDDNDIPEGSTLHIIDTGEEYVYFNGTWERDLRMITAIKDANL